MPGTLLFLITWNMGGNWGKKTTKKINKNRRGANQKVRHEENPLTLRSCFLFSVSIDPCPLPCVPQSLLILISLQLSVHLSILQALRYYL